MIPLSIAAVIPAGIIAWLALSKKTSPHIKRVAIGALIVILITLVVCTIIIIFSGSRTVVVRGLAEPPPNSAPAVEGKSNIPLIITLAVIMLFLIWVIFVSIRDQRKQKRG
jgi:uncharacterized BrkB/YihY/UPF0761 family membrane protein